MFTLWALGPLLNVLLAAASSEHRVIPIDQLVQSLAISHDGKLVATGCMRIGNTGPDDRIAVWDVATGKLQRTSSKHPFGFPHPVAFSKDGKRVISYRAIEKEGILKQHVYSLDVTSGREDIIFNGEGYRGCLTLLPDKLIVVLRGGGKAPAEVHVRDLTTGPKADLKGHQLLCQTAAISADGKTVATYDGTAVKIWDFPSGKERYHLPVTSADSNMPLSLSPDGKLLAYKAQPKPFLWDIAPGQKAPKRLKTPARDVWETIPIVYRFGAMCFSPDGRYLAVKVNVHDESFWDFRERQRAAETIELWSLPDCRRVATLRAPSLVRAGLSLRHLAFSGDGSWLAAAGSSGHVHLWRVPGH